VGVMSNSEKNVEALRKTIEEQKKILNFFQSRFREQTGSELELPQTWSKFLNINEANAPLVDDDAKMFQSLVASAHPQGSVTQSILINPGGGHMPVHSGDRNFLQSYYDLKLPKKKPDTKGGARGQAGSAASIGRSAQVGTSNPKRGGATTGIKKKKETSTNFDEKNPYHMVEKLDLSDFRGRGFSRAGLREFLEGIEDMRCLSTVILRNNGINDDFVEELGNLYLPRTTIFK